MVKVIILSGVPGSGKSTWVKENHADATVCSADRYFMRTGTYQFKVTELADAHGYCMRKFVENLRAATEDGETCTIIVDNTIPQQILENCVLNYGETCTIIVDNTNTTSEEIVPYYAVAQAYGCEIELITFEADPALAAARNVHGVPAAGVNAMAKRLESRELPDFWKYNEKFSQRTVRG